ncbi:MAG: GIY-YIG nuclease family protein [Verrucomicrobia bacterium]|nr:MAG: GIY-YIG nuclease family protein [Verrucomicrobiota bacterium]
MSELTSKFHPFPSISIQYPKTMTQRTPTWILATHKYVPWKLVTYLEFSMREQASTFESYLKSGSGRVIAAKRL